MLIDYDRSRAALFHPETRATVFGTGVCSGPEGVAVEATRLAYVRAEAAPDDLARLTEDLEKAGFGAPTLFNDRRTGSQGFGSLRHDRLALIAFRGTQADHLRDLLTDIRFLRTPWPKVGGRVHAGFADAAAALWPQVEAWLATAAADRRELLMCGHSLGAAIATLLALPSGATHLLTIGSPRVGDSRFAAAFGAAGVATSRIVGFEDIVTRLPPSTAPFGFRHVGRAVFIDGNGSVSHDPPPEAVDANIDFMTASVATAALIAGGELPRQLSDHAPVNYLRAFWR